MRRLLLVLAIAAVLFVGVPVHADDPTAVRFGDYLDALRIQAGIPGLAAAIVGRTDIAWERAFGQQDVGRSIAARPDTPFHLDGLTQIFTASLVLRCAEEGRLSLDDRLGQLNNDAGEPDATIRQVLSHTSGAPGDQVFSYRPERLEPLRAIVRSCAGGSYRKSLGELFDRLAMINSVPGPDVLELKPPAEGIPTPAAAAHYADVLGHLATPYAVNAQGRATPTQYTATTLTPAEGMISTVRDIAQFDLALRRGILLRLDTLDDAWRAPVSASGQRLPHGLGWFVQTYNGERVAWQFGEGDNGSSSMIVTVPGRALTLVLLANSNGLAKSFPMAAGDLTVSPFARSFLGLFVR